MLIRAVAATVCFSLLAGCASPQRQQRSRQAAMAERILSQVDERADPGKVAATDFALARQARDEGQWSALLAYAAPGAQLHDASGVTDAAAWLTGRPDPAQAMARAPREVWSSCDGSLAVSFGRSRGADGIIGSYAAVWQRQRGGSYKWTYMIGTPDVPQPPPPPPGDAVPDEDTIVVGALQAITARAADCPQRERAADLPPPPPAPSAAGGAPEPVLTRSRDGTLAWRVDQTGPASWRMVVEWQRGGEWMQALAFALPDGES